MEKLRSSHLRRHGKERIQITVNVKWANLIARVAGGDRGALLVPDPTRDGAEGFDYDRARPIAATIISKLPDDRRTLLTLAYIEGESRQSLAKRFGVPVGTIKTWLRRTLETVRTDCTLLVERQTATAS